MTPPLPAVGDWVDIHYHRLHKGTTVFRQQVLESRATHIVTFQHATALDNPVLVENRPVLETGSPVIWFTMPDRGHDIGIFHRGNGTRTGLYANVLTPVEFVSPTRWLTTDLFLDWWVPDHGDPRLLDQDELAKALEAGLVDTDRARRATEEAARIHADWETGAWPPDFVDGWTLARARRIAEGTSEAVE